MSSFTLESPVVTFISFVHLTYISWVPTTCQAPLVLYKQSSLQWFVPCLLNETEQSAPDVSVVGIFNGTCVIWLGICLISFVTIGFTIWRIDLWLPSLNLRHNLVMKSVWKHREWVPLLSHSPVPCFWLPEAQAPSILKERGSTHLWTCSVQNWF